VLSGRGLSVVSVVCCQVEGCLVSVVCCQVVMYFVIKA
jgi:hypothetical protein